MDLSTAQAKLFKYRSFAEFEDDVALMVSNCIFYNGRNSYYGEVSHISLDENEDLKVLSRQSIFCSDRGKSAEEVESQGGCSAGVCQGKGGVDCDRKRKIRREKRRERIRGGDGGRVVFFFI